MMLRASLPTRSAPDGGVGGIQPGRAGLAQDSGLGVRFALCQQHFFDLVGLLQLHLDDFQI